MDIKYFKGKLFLSNQIKTINHGLWVPLSATQINLCSIKCIVVQRCYFLFLWSLFQKRQHIHILSLSCMYLSIFSICCLYQKWIDSVQCVIYYLLSLSPSPGYRGLGRNLANGSLPFFFFFCQIVNFQVGADAYI